MKLRYTPAALAELDAVLDHIAEHSPRGAKRVQTRLHATITLLLDHPTSGLATDAPPMRRMGVKPYPYLIFYELSDNEIVIVGVRHAARNPSTMPGQL